MSTPELRKKGKKIRSRVAALATFGAMRPGTLPVQYRNPGERQTPFHQISYTHKNRSRSQYVRPENLPAATSRRSSTCRWRPRARATGAGRRPAPQRPSPQTSAGPPSQ